MSKQHKVYRVRERARLLNDIPRYVEVSFQKLVGCYACFKGQGDEEYFIGYGQTKENALAQFLDRHYEFQMGGIPT